MDADSRRLLEEERDLLIAILRRLGHTGVEEGPSTDRLFLILGVNAYRLSLPELPPHILAQMSAGMAIVRDLHEQVCGAGKLH